MNWYRAIPISDHATTVKVANANFMLFPREIYLRLGGINGEYRHGNADSDIILRANRLGIITRAVPGILGYCQSNKMYLNKSLTRMISHEFSKKRTPLFDIIRICKAQYDALWPLLFLDFIMAIFYRQTKNWVIGNKKARFPNSWFK